MPKVLIAPVPLANLQGAFLDILRGAGLEPVYHNYGHQMVEEELLKALDGIEATLAGSEPYTARVFAAHPQLRAIARAGVGYDAVDLDAATKTGTAVCIAPGTNQGAVAEHMFTLLLGITRNLVSQHLGVKSGGWPRGVTLPLRGRTLGIAGLGRIGKAVAERARAFGMKLLAYEPQPDQAFVAAHHITLVPFERLLAESDYLTLHLPMMPQTRHLINRKTLALMKPTAFLINTARGGLVNEADLLDALKNKRIAGAALDVFEEEPPGKSPLFELDNVLMTPHAAGMDMQARDDMAACAAEAIVSLYKGQWPAEKIVNPEVKAHYRWTRA